MPEGERFDQARDLFHDHRWVQNKPFMGDDQFAELLVVLAPWFREEFAQKKARVSVRERPPKVDKGSQHLGRKRVYDRSAGRCEADIPSVCTYVAREWHHRKPRSLGGRWDPSNGMHLCVDCHLYITTHPAHAQRAGWTVKATATPAEVPLMRRGAWGYLDDDGGFEPVEKGTAA